MTVSVLITVVGLCHIAALQHTQYALSLKLDVLCCAVGLINKYVVAAAVIERRMADAGVPNKTISWTEENCVTKFTNCKLLRGGKIVEVITKSFAPIKSFF